MPVSIKYIAEAAGVSRRDPSGGGAARRDALLAGRAQARRRVVRVGRGICATTPVLRRRRRERRPSIRRADRARPCRRSRGGVDE